MATSGTLTFEPGETWKRIDVPVLDDDVDEGNETMRLTLSNLSSAAVFLDGTATGTITDVSASQPEQTPLTAEFRDEPASHDGASAFTLRLAFSAAVTSTPEALRGHVLSASGGTVSGVSRVDGASDLFAVTVTPTGAGIVTVTLGPTPSDCAAAGAVCTADGVALSGRYTTRVRGPGSWLTVADAVATEGEDTALDFVVTLAPASAATVTVAYATANGTATAGADYDETSGTLTFGSRETAKTVSVPIIDDGVEDGGETLTLTLSNPTGAALDDPVAIGTIANDEVLTTVTVSPATSPLTEGETLLFTLERTGATDSGLTVSVAVSEVGAVLSGTLPDEVVFAAGSTTARLTVATEDDEQGEADARVTVTVGEGVGYVASGAAGTASVDVLDDDPVEAAKRTVWTAQLTVKDLGSGLGFVDSDDLVPHEWTEDEQEYGAESLQFAAEQQKLSLGVTDELPASGELLLYLDERVLRLSDAAYSEEVYSWTSVSGLAWQAGQKVAVKLERVPALPGVTVLDAAVPEAAGAALLFEVRLGSQRSEAVTVRYMTSDATATAGVDYEAASGVVRFEAGETERTVRVSVLDDDHDEGTETLNLTLSRPYGAELADGEAVGSIVNSDPLPRAWLSRFGHTVAAHVLDAVEMRLRGAGETQATLGGRRLQRAQETAVAKEPDDAAFHRTWFGSTPSSMGLRELVAGSSFSVSEERGTGEDGSGGGRWTVWGRAGWSAFAGREEATAVDGEVWTGTVGSDWEQDQWLFGVALAYSTGSGGYRGTGAGEAESWLASVHPYGRLSLHDRLDLWGVLGYGFLGEMRLSAPKVETDLGMAMGALGLRGTLLQGQTGGFELIGKADGLVLRMESGAVPNLAATEATVERWRLLLEASYGALPLLGGTLAPAAEVGGPIRPR